MALSSALYYPYIDIANGEWLKSAILYWDALRTIVPRDYDHPYRSATSRRLADEGILRPCPVGSSDALVDGLTQDVMRYLDAPEGVAVLGGTGDRRLSPMHPSKLPEEVRRLVSIHPSKMPYYLRDKLRHSLRGGWMAVDERFAAFYMTLLASRVAGDNGLGLLADAPGTDRLANTSRRGAADWRLERSHDLPMPSQPGVLAEGMLADLVLKQVQVDPRTPLKTLLAFRRDHADEIARFRTESARLARLASMGATSMDGLRQAVEDAYLNEVTPALAALRDALRGARIKAITDTVLKTSFFSVSATSIPLALAGLSAPFALLAGAAVSLAVGTAHYSVDRRSRLTASPYAFLLTAEKMLRRPQRGAG